MAAKIDANKQIRWAVDSGRVMFGQRSVEKTLLNGKGQLVIVCGNVPKRTAEKVAALAKVAGVARYNYNGTGHELGSVCGKPFVVSLMAVLEPGKSKVMELVKAGQ